MASYTIRLHPKADEDFIKAYAWYEERREGLGEKFIAAVRQKLKAITDNPEAFGSRNDISYREVSLHTFPYIVVYKIY